MRDEVYNYGSFLQSRMYAAGVTCSDCHDAHDQKVKVGRDDVCSSCHQPERFARARAPLPQGEGQGRLVRRPATCGPRPTWWSTRATTTRCACRARTSRSKLGRDAAPNACNDCHKDRTARWAAARVRRVVPAGPADDAALRRGDPGRAHVRRRRGAGAPRGRARRQAAGDRPRHGGVAPRRRTSRRSRCPRCRRPPPTPTRSSGSAPRPCSRRCPPERGPGSGSRSCGTPCGRCASRPASAFADVPDAELATEQRAALDRALDDFFLAQRSNAERPESHVNLGHRLREARAGRPRRGAPTRPRCASRRSSCRRTSTSPT